MYSVIPGRQINAASDFSLTHWVLNPVRNEDELLCLTEPRHGALTRIKESQIFHDITPSREGTLHNALMECNVHCLTQEAANDLRLIEIPIHGRFWSQGTNSFSIIEEHPPQFISGLQGNHTSLKVSTDCPRLTSERAGHQVRFQALVVRENEDSPLRGDLSKNGCKPVNADVIEGMHGVVKH